MIAFHIINCFVLSVCWGMVGETEQKCLYSKQEMSPKVYNSNNQKVEKKVIEKIFPYPISYSYFLVTRNERYRRCSNQTETNSASSVVNLHKKNMSTLKKGSSDLSIKHKLLSPNTNWNFHRIPRFYFRSYFLKNGKHFKFKSDDKSATSENGAGAKYVKQMYHKRSLLSTKIYTKPQQKYKSKILQNSSPETGNHARENNFDTLVNLDMEIKVKSDNSTNSFTGIKCSLYSFCNFLRGFYITNIWKKCEVRNQEYMNYKWKTKSNHRKIEKNTPRIRSKRSTKESSNYSTEIHHDILNDKLQASNNSNLINNNNYYLWLREWSRRRIKFGKKYG